MTRIEPRNFSDEPAHEELDDRGTCPSCGDPAPIDNSPCESCKALCPVCNESRTSKAESGLCLTCEATKDVPEEQLSEVLARIVNDPQLV